MMGAELTITYVGGPTALIELGGLRLLTDPTFDPPGGRYRFGWGTGSRKLSAPALSVEQVGRVDAILLSHDHHDDNLDPAGRAMLPTAGRVLTTPAGARRLGGNASGLEPWSSTALAAPGGGELRVTATPARHGPPLSRPIVGEVVGFVLEWQGATVWISGDTVYFPGLAPLAERFDVDIAVVHMGGVRFPVSGPLRYTMNAAEGVRIVRDLDPRVVVPIHYEGWKHFREGRGAIERAFVEAGMERLLRWPRAGHAERIAIAVDGVASEPPAQ